MGYRAGNRQFGTFDINYTGRPRAHRSRSLLTRLPATAKYLEYRDLILSQLGVG
jgi:hypothetical protein